MTIDLEAVRSDDVTMSPDQSEMPATARETEDQEYMSDISSDVRNAPENEREIEVAKTEEASAATESDPTLDEGGKPFGDRPGETDARLDEGRRRRGISPLGAGFVGGVAALALVAALQWFAILPGFSRNEPVSQSAGIAEIQQELAALKTRIDASQTPAGDNDERLQALRQDLDGVTKSVAELQAGFQTIDIPDLKQSLASFEQQKLDLTQELQKNQSAGQAGAVNDPVLSARIAALDEKVARLSAPDTADNLARLQSAVDKSDQAERSLGEISSQMAMVASRLDALEASTAKLDEGPKLALIVAATALRGAIESGRPFAAELKTYVALSGPSPELDAILPWADKGIPGDAAIAAQASEVADSIARSQSSKDPTQGIVDKLLSSASQLVTMRPVGEVEGDAPGQIAARMEAAAKRGDFTAAMADFDRLPDAVRRDYSAFSESLRARTASMDIIRDSLSHVLAP